MTKLPYILDGGPPAELVAKIRACARTARCHPRLVDDVVQEVCLRLLGMPRERWLAIINQESYLRVMTRNVSNTWWRRRQRQDSKHESLMNSEKHKVEGPPADVADAACARADLLRMLEPLGPECAEVFIRSRLYERPVKEIALQMSIPVSRVRAHQKRADVHFMEMLEEDRKSLSIKGRLMRLFTRG